MSHPYENTLHEDLIHCADASALIECCEAAIDDERPTVILDKYVVETEFFDTVECNFWGILPHLLEETDYTPEELCGEALWTELSEHDRRIAVLCLKHLASLENFPLYEERCAASNTVHFRIF